MKNQSKIKNDVKLDNYYEAQKVPMTVRALRLYFSRLGWLFPKSSAKLFWNLFTQPRSRTIKDWHREFLASADERNFFQIKNFEYTTYGWGDGPKTVVLVHGWNGMTTDFKKLIDALLEEGGYRILAIEMPAHGQTPGKQSHLPAFMKGIMHILKQEQHIHALIGHSLGANASFFALEALKDEVKADHLVMLGAYPIPYHFFRTFKEFMHIPEHLYEQIIDYVSGLLDMKVRYMNMYELKYNLPVEQVMLVHDNKDEVADINKIKALAADWPGVEVLFGDHGGHFRHFRHDEVVNSIIEQMKQTEALPA